MRYYFLLACFCLLGMASSQSIEELTSCLTKDNNLIMECKFTPQTGKTDSTTCTYKTENKVVASTSTSISPESTFKNRASVKIENRVCNLTLNGLSDDQPKAYSCFIQSGGNATKSAIVDKKTTPSCSACKLSAVTLLLAFLFFPLLSELL